MADTSPVDANEFIEQQLQETLRDLRDEFSADMLSFSGPVYFRINELGLRIDDLSGNHDRWMKVRKYHSLSEDYIGKLGRDGAIHGGDRIVPVRTRR